MGVDYRTYIGIGRQVNIDHDFNWSKFVEEVECKYKDIEVLVLRQEYKGDMCSSGLFVGIIFYDTDTTNHNPLDIETLQHKLSEPHDIEKIDKACQEVKEILALPDDFGKYGVHILCGAY